jgi:5-methylthioribose kinase
METLTRESVGPYLRDRGVLSGAGASVEELGGGVSNVVLRVRGDDRCLVVKQPLENLAVEDDWPADLVRVHNEAAAARAYGRLLSTGPGLAVRVPAVEFEDEDDHVIALECGPSGSETWKAALLDGTVEATIAARLGGFLARSHAWAHDDPGLRETFAHDEPFDQLRVDPYHRTVAERHPDVADAIAEEIERLTRTKRTLVHGDFSPKNVLVAPAGPDEPVWLLDFEVAHWGDPAFDAAFMLNHLFIKAVYVGGVGRGPRSAFREAATSFWEAYRAGVEWDLEADVVRELGILMLARVDGKSPVEYVTDPETKETLRTVAKRSLGEPVATVDAFSRLVAEVSGR